MGEGGGGARRLGQDVGEEAEGDLGLLQGGLVGQARSHLWQVEWWQVTGGTNPPSSPTYPPCPGRPRPPSPPACPLPPVRCAARSAENLQFFGDFGLLLAVFEL